jgi:hypothetical protein
MSRFLRSAETPEAPARRRSVYEDRPAPTRPWIQVAETNPFTGELDWASDWGRRVSGWMPFDEFLREAVTRP